MRGGQETYNKVRGLRIEMTTVAGAALWGVHDHAKVVLPPKACMSRKILQSTSGTPRYSIVILYTTVDVLAANDG